MPFQLPRTRQYTLRNIVIKADPDYQLESLNPVEYDYSTKPGGRLFRGYYQSRGAYSDE